MQFKDTSTKLGLIEDCEVKVFGDNSYGRISGDTDLLYQFTARINRAQDSFVYLAMTSDGRWQYDDTNYTDYGIATTNLVSGQRDYTFAVEHLEIEKVLIQDSSGNWIQLDTYDENDRDYKVYFEQSQSGTPTKYNKRSNSIFFNYTPNYSATGGLKIYFKRGPSYFVYSDTTKVPGIPSIFHGYLSLHASAYYAIDRTLTNAKSLYGLLEKEEARIKDFYSGRNKDERPRFKVNQSNSTR
jgi:hypothetical protein